MKELLTRYPSLNQCEKDINLATKTLISCYEGGGKLLLCGNGGSSSDCDHIVGELMKGFMKKRPLTDKQKSKMKKSFDISDDVLGKLQGGLPAISLPSFSALNTAFCNDVDPELIYAQAVLGLAKKGDVLIALSTSGNSKNVVRAVEVAKALGVTVISMTGESGGKLKPISNVCICVPETETYKVQELHLPVYHYICAEIENHFFKA